MQAQNTPTGTDPHKWNCYIRSARTFSEASDRIEKAINAGVDFGSMQAFNLRRFSRIEDASWPAL